MSREHWRISWLGSNYPPGKLGASHSFAVKLDSQSECICTVECGERALDEFIAAVNQEWDDELASIALCVERVKSCRFEEDLATYPLRTDSNHTSITLEQVQKLKNGDPIEIPHMDF